MKERVVVITGASSGIGRATAQCLAQKGDFIALVARNERALYATQQEVEALGGKARIYILDVSDAEAVENIASQIETDMGPIDLWINNAMVSTMAPFTELDPAEYRRITEVSYLGYVWGTMAALKRMRARNHGTIVQVGSALAFRSIPLQSAYCGAKHAINGFTESIRCELLHDDSNIHITIVHLPGVNTPQFNWVRNKMLYRSKPVGPIFQPSVAANAIAWAAEHRRKEIYVGRPTLEAIWGNKFFSSLMDRFLSHIVYKRHFTKEREPLHRPDNLFSAVNTDYGVHGPYSQNANTNSVQLFATQNRLAIGFGFFAFALMTYLQRNKRTRGSA